MHQPALTEHAMQACIEACSHCHQICLHTAMNHCLKAGGKHVKAKHFRLLMNCAEICQLSANFQLGSSVFQHRLCAICAEVCEACATDCEEIGDMDECVQACRECAESCRQMAAVEH
ncbi:four-helix bundle copper-binding protein [Methylococcus sp. EFPC2]|uniref:four-helix bundle copper-binding protein n=1 Tax=Methylococcus sp. EFPC2 TaxID=2812648 RepID=UPI0019675D7A|nr:four-helix bundle copper-binding protein [Methylococcus sp. EFPC2]QSA97752.1 four-helix bundle copper-binding protein [Methylococcus sp. EFPC2]